MKKIKLLTSIVRILLVVSFFLFGMSIGYELDRDVYRDSKEVIEEKDVEEYIPLISQEEAVIKVVEEVSPAVVSIIVTKDLPRIEIDFFNPWFFDGLFPEIEPEEIETERREVGGGTGFIISADGLVLTNRHVVQDEDAEYTILTNDGRRFDAEILARDPVQDLAIMRIKEGNGFPTVKIGDSSEVRIGQTVIAIGNSLGEFRNTVSVGVVSGLGRSLSATDGRAVQILEDVIQTDAAINRGNSGGPLLNLRGEVIGINTAMAVGAQNIGFSIPVNKSERMIESVKTHGELIYPFLGISYFMIDERVQRENNLPVNYGAIIRRSSDNPAIKPGSAAERAGLKEGDIILYFGETKLDSIHLAEVILRYNPGDEVRLRVMRNGNEIVLDVTLDKKTW